MTTRGEATPRAPAPSRMATREHDRFVLVWHGTESPSQADWDAAVQVVGRHASRPLRVSLACEHLGLDAAERKVAAQFAEQQRGT